VVILLLYLLLSSNKAKFSILDNVERMFIPFNEPIIAASKLPAVTAVQQMPGSHWAALAIYPKQKLVLYLSSLSRNSHAMDAMQVCNTQISLKPTADRGQQLAKSYLKLVSERRAGDKGKYQEAEWQFVVQKVSNHLYQLPRLIQ
jgi:hypothetical protein